MTVITTIEDLRLLAKKRVPRMFYDYADSGSWTESTYRANSEDFQKIKLRQRVAVNMENRSTATTMVGQATTMPVCIAPVGLTGMQHADGEIHAARAAEKFGIPFTLSTMSICSIEDVAQNTRSPFWFQLYMMRDRDAMAAMIERCRQAKCSALVLTLDLQVIGQRHKDLKNGMTAPPKPTLANIINLMTKPRWCLGMAGTRRHSFGNLVGHAKGVSDMSSLSSWTREQFDPKLDWNDVEWIKKRWGGKLILKGIQDVEDARLAVSSGADALIVSNHGGRQLDGAQTSIEALPAIVAAAEVALRGAGYVMVLCDTHEQPELQDEYLLEMRSHYARGLVLLGAVDSPVLRSFVRGGEPLVFVNRRSPVVGDGQRYVGIDNLGAGAEVARWVAAQGFGAVGLIHARLSSSATADRVTGFRAGLKACGIPLPAARIQTVAGAEHLQIGYRGMQRLLAQARPPKVVFCTSDLIAYGAHRWAHEAGLQVGRDLVLVGFDDSPMNAWVAPWLHAVRVPYAAYGEAIVSALADTTATAIILPHELVIRA